MTHVFDTGQSTPQRTMVEEGAVDRLSGLLRRNGGYLYSVIPFGGIVRTYTDEEGIASLIDALKGTPAVAISSATRTYDTGNLGGGGIGSGGMQAQSELELLIYVATQHRRNMSSGRKRSDVVAQADGRADPGLHVMMEHIVELMMGQRVGAGTSVKQLRPVREEELVTREAVTIWLLTFRVKLMTMTPLGGGGREFRNAPQLLESIGWRVTTDKTEDARPAPAKFSTSVDADTDL